MGVMVSGSVKTGVAVPRDIMEEFEDLAKKLGYRSRSRAFQDAVQLFITTHRWVGLSGLLAGCVVVIYNHEEHGVEERLTDIQHRFLDVISAAMHIHLTSTHCMLVITLRGDAGRVKDLYKELSGIRGVTHIQPAFSLIPRD
ncbi:MAG: ribbon-helix-helix protein, CopG family [Sulfolobales archaeon]|nr:ribbon-helix-helix protein, CopG family [Sulfolobales archaeon]